nr:MAG TPA: hypothetical protein [Caudoviricetes sp.]
MVFIFVSPLFHFLFFGELLLLSPFDTYIISLFAQIVNRFCTNTSNNITQIYYIYFVQIVY